jgi:hypothetical protein
MRHLRPIEATADRASDEPRTDRPTTRGGSRRSDWRDGLAAQTVIEKLENFRSYRAFERGIIASVEPRSVIELELGHRLANLLWRLRRASAIETGLFEIQGEFLLGRRQEPLCGIRPTGASRSFPSSERPCENAPLEWTTRSAGRQSSTVVNFHAPAARPIVEFPRHRAILSAPFQSRPHLARSRRRL